MRHLVKGKKLNRNTAHRISMLKNMAISLICHEQIITTLPKAVFLRPFVEKILTIGKRYHSTSTNHERLAFRRLLIARLGTQNPIVINKVLDILSERYINRAGGYSRIMKYYVRSDSTQMAVIEFVDRDESARGQASLK